MTLLGQPLSYVLYTADGHRPGKALSERKTLNSLSIMSYTVEQLELFVYDFTLFRVSVVCSKHNIHSG